MPSKLEGSFSVIGLSLLVLCGGCINPSAPAGIANPAKPASVSDVQVSLASSSLMPGETTHATVLSADGIVMDGSIAFSSDAPAVATVSPAGVITAVSTGVAIIRATVTVASLTPPATSFTLGSSRNRPVTAAQLAANPIAAQTSRTGSAIIPDGPYETTAFASLTVRQGAGSPVKSVAVTTDSLTLGVGHQSQAAATATDAHGSIVSGQAISWVSLSPGTATVSSSGVVTAVAPGVATIGAEVAGVLSSTSLTVVSPPKPVGHDFEDGKWGPFDHFSPADEDIINDPTGAGKGKVARFHYVGINQDRNRFLEYRRPVTLGQSMFFKGEFYLPLDSLGDGRAGRKLIFWQNHQDYEKYGANTPTFQMILELFGSDLKVMLVSVRKAGGEPQQTTNIASNIKPRQWYTLESQITFESKLGAGDGVARIWLDGTLVYENLHVSWTDPAYIGHPVPGGTATPLDAADVYFDAFLVGQQVDFNNMISYDEYRYWDNVRFSTERVGQ